jgi:UDP-4-amino-4,6-dideoxy-N-acetyl-beta-L-altrosamine transaminase
MLPYGRHVIEDDDVDAVVRVLKGDFLTTGPAVEAFEAALADRLGAAHAVSCNSGTAALHLAYMALGLGEGDTVIVPAMTFVATASCARHVGAEVLFADVDPDTGLMRPEDLLATIHKAGPRRLRAVAPVHMAGQCEDMAAISAIAREHDMLVVEDAAHAVGTRYRDTVIGDNAYSDAACFSFHPVKTIAAGEGGAVTTASGEAARHMKTMRHHGLVRDPEHFQNRDLAFDTDGMANPWYGEMPAPGFNHRLSDIHAALGLSQLAKLDRFVARRREIVALYDQLLVNLAPRVMPLTKHSWCEPAWHLYVALIDFGVLGRSRAEVMAALRERGVGTQVHYVPVPFQPGFGSARGNEYPGAEAYYRRCLSLPLFPSMSDADVVRVAEALADVVSA